MISDVSTHLTNSNTYTVIILTLYTRIRIAFILYVLTSVTDKYLNKTLTNNVIGLHNIIIDDDK